jgi:hypothetical protein
LRGYTALSLPRDGLESGSAFILRRRLLEELIEQFLLLELGQVARKILLDTLADSRRKFFKNLLVDLPLCSQPADVTAAALDEPLDVVGNLADEPPFELELQIVIVGQWRAPVLLGGGAMTGAWQRARLWLPLRRASHL